MGDDGQGVAVRRAGDTVQVGDDPGELDVLGSRLDLPGGSVLYDARTPDALPFGEIEDPRAAQPWVHEVFGPATAELLRSAADGVEASAAAAGHRSVAGEALARIAFGLWLWRYWPVDAGVAPIDPALLRIELGALAWGLDDHLGGPELAARLLRGQLQVLRGGASVLAADGGDGPAATALVGALDAVVIGEAGALSGADEDELDLLDDLLTAIVRRVDRGPGVELERWVLDRYAELGRAAVRVTRQQDVSLAAPVVGGGSAVTDVDWLQVPPRAVAWADGGVRTSLGPAPGADGSWHARVEVDAVPAEGQDPVLGARIYAQADDGGLPIGLVRLSRVGDLFVGETTVRTAGPLVVDVYGIDSVRRPRISARARGAAGRARGEARRIIRERSARVVDGGAARRFLAEGPPA